MFEKIGDMQQANNFNGGAYFLLAFPIKCLSKRLSQILGTARQGKTFPLTATLLAQKQNLPVALDNGSGRITYPWNQIIHTQIC